MIANETHGLLRARTATLHQRTEQAFAVFDLTLRSGYTRFLQAQAAALMPLEAWLDSQGIETALPDWPTRRRGPLLEADLAVLGAPCPAGPAARPEGDPLGVAYVLEGSRFGGRVLLRAVASQADREVAGATRFLGQPWSRERWTALLDTMGSLAIDEHRQQMLVRGAAAAFAHFEACARHVAVALTPPHASPASRAGLEGQAAHPSADAVY